MIHCNELTKTFRRNGSEVVSLDRVTLEVEAGEFVVVRGPSGSGKTTLLLSMGGMQRPSAGTVALAGENLYAMSSTDRAKVRASEVGFVFQMFHLVPYLGLLENILLAAPAWPSAEARTRANELLEQFGLAKRATHRPDELSAGERQRLAVARAMLNRPKVLLADEPTGNLDSENAAGVIEHFKQFHQEGGTVVLVTHGTAAYAVASRVVRLDQGRLVAD
jgi:putative ABC transport system ATP-binding protein